MDDKDKLKHQLLLEFLSYFNHGTRDKITKFNRVIQKQGKNENINKFLFLLNTHAQKLTVGNKKEPFKVTSEILDDLLTKFNNAEKESDIDEIVYFTNEDIKRNMAAGNYISASEWREFKQTVIAGYKENNYDNSKKIKLLIKVLLYALDNEEKVQGVRINSYQIQANKFNLNNKRNLWLGLAANIINDLKGIDEKTKKELTAILKEPFSKYLKEDKKKYDQRYYQQNFLAALLYLNKPEILINLGEMEIDLKQFTIKSNYHKSKETNFVDYLAAKIKISKSKSNRAKYEKLSIYLAINNNVSAPDNNKLNKI